MRGYLTVVLLMIASLTYPAALAQTPPGPGDPPVAALISVSAPDEEGIVTLTGAAGAVFPNATVAVRNLFTEQVTYVQGGITGSFVARLYGPGNTPFWISAADSIPFNLRNVPGALPGGPGTIIYGALPEARQPGTLITRLIVDGNLDDWRAYPQARSGSAYSLWNRESLYVGLAGDDVPSEYAQLRVTFTLDGATYALTLDPRLLQTATLRRLTPVEADLGTLAVAAIQTDAIEMRIPLAAIDDRIEAASLNTMQFLDANGAEIASQSVERVLTAVDEVDGVVYPDGGLSSSNLPRFSVSGPVAQGAATWTARGRVQTLQLKPGDTLHLEMDVTLAAPDLPDSLVGLRMIGQLGLQPVIGPDGMQAAGGLNSNNGWSSLLTPSGLGIDNVRGDFMLGETAAEPQQVIRRGDELTFGLDFVLKLPDDLPQGVYAPFFHGLAQVGDGDVFKWEDNSPFGTGPGLSRVPLTRLPLVLTVGETSANRLAWALFYDDPSDGSRGELPEEDRQRVALSNRVRFDSPTYILPPGAYSIEPYLLNQMPNAYDTSGAPLIPLLTPGGRLDAQVTRPDGSVDNVGAASIVQSWLSSEAVNTRAVWGARSPLDVYRLSTLNPLFMAYPFEQYGTYQIQLAGTAEDIWSNRYEGGGTYTLVIAELLDLTPGVLPGTPFEVGDAFYPGLHLAPGVPADVTVKVRVYPLDGAPVVEREFTGEADRSGFFQPGSAFVFETPGEYVIDYEARYSDAQGRLWAGSLRSAGVIATPNSALIAHGQRGLDGYDDEAPPAWFTTRLYPPDSTGVAPIVNFPYYSGDVAWVADTPADGVRPAMAVQDTGGALESWLLGTLPDYVSPGGRSLQRLAVEDALPLISVMGGAGGRYSPALVPHSIVSESYAYLSAVRPAVTVRQFVQGSDDGGLLVSWDADDPYNHQIGVGATGDRPGDFAFLFGGLVVRNAEADVQDAAIYAALAVTTDARDPLGTRIYPPFRGEAGGANGGPLLTVRGEPIYTFFHPTGVLPGQVLTRGETLTIAGQVAPPLTSHVAVTVTSPTGASHHFEGAASAVGYYHDPANAITLDEVGVWQVHIKVWHDGLTSAGLVEPPYPSGGVLGALNGSFPVYVAPPDAAPLETNKGASVDAATRPASPINFLATVPDGWHDVAAYRTVTMPGYILEDGALQVFENSVGYQYSPMQLNRDFPNVEIDQRTSGPAASDVVTITLVVTGVDENGIPQARSRTFTLMHDRLVSLES